MKSQNNCRNETGSAERIIVSLEYGVFDCQSLNHIRNLIRFCHRAFLLQNSKNGNISSASIKHW